MNKPRSSYLSPNVRQLLRLAAESCHDTRLNEQALQCIRKEGDVLVLEDQPILFLLKGVELDESAAAPGVGVRDAQWYRVVMRRLSPFFNFCHEMLQYEKFDHESMKSDPCVQWLANPELISEAIDLLQRRDDKGVVIEVLLSLTPMLERSLGNILFTADKNTNVPSLLRDLINHDQVQEAIGGAGCLNVLLLHLFMGTPSGLNLRNLVWHGFPRPGEISPALASSLIILAFSIGESLQSRGVIVEKRPTVALLGQSGLFSKTERIFNQIQKSSDEIAKDFIENVQHDNPKALLLQRAHRLYGQSKFRHAVYLLLPEWECLLRGCYANANQCPSRSMTAEDDRLYTTFDEILSRKRVEINDDGETVESDNTLPSVLGEGRMALLLDCLLLPEGPRLRDKIGHGEVDLDEDMSNSMFKLAVGIIMASITNLIRMDSAFDKYTSLFHPKALLASEVEELLSLLQGLVDNPVLKNEQELSPDDPLFPLEHHRDSASLSALDLTKLKNRTLYRPKSEYVLVSLHRRILAQMKLAVERTRENIDDKRARFESNDLNSRQLATYSRIVKTAPRMCFLFQLWILIILKQLELFADPLDEDKVKLDKKMLKYSQNLAHNSHLVKNRWEESGQIVTKAAVQIAEERILSDDRK